MRSKKALINVITSLLVQVVTIICGLIIPRLIIETYGSSVNGLITSITQFLAFIALIEAGFGPVIKSTLFKPIAEKDKNKIANILKTSENLFRKISYIFIAYIIVLCFALPFTLSDEFDGAFTASLIVIISVTTFAEYYFGMTYSLYLQAEQKKYIVSIIQIGTMILNTIVVLVLIHFKSSIQIVKLASTAIFILRPILQTIYVRRKFNINLKNASGDYKIKQKWDGLIQHIAFIIHNNADVVILTLFTSLTEVSVYSIYLMIINAIMHIVRAFAGGIDAMLGDMLVKGEKEQLNKGFNLYEGVYITISTIVFCSTLFLILPFVSIYTKGISDADYIRPAFAYIIVIAEFIFVIRQPYNDLVKVAGHFKQTRTGALAEAISNIVISLALVWKFGLVGVAIGTLIAMIIRTTELMYYSSKYILQRKVWYAFKRIITITIEMGIIACLINIIPKVEVHNFKTWFIQAIIVTSISTFIVAIINILIYRKNSKNIVTKIKSVLTK